MIDRVRIRGFRAHADTRLELGRFTVLVGDNASGKTSVLDALRVLSHLANGPGVPAFPWNLEPSDLFARSGNGVIGFEANGSVAGERWAVETTVTERAQPLQPFLGPIVGWDLSIEGMRAGRGFRRVVPLTTQGGVHNTFDDDNNLFRGAIPETLGAVEAFNLRSDQIAAAAHSDETDVRVGFDGSNTAVVLAAMKLSDDPAFERIASATRRLIPTMERIRLGRAEARDGSRRIGNKILLDFRGASGIPAHAASHGTLVVLALLTILFGPRRPSMILLDDLDHALHPRAQMELMKLLRELLALPEFADLQIVATTHSPYVLDMVEPEGVYAFAMRDDGTSASKRLSEHPDAAKTKGMLAAGQLWSLDAEHKWVFRDAS